MSSIDLVAAGARLHQVYCGICHSLPNRAGESGKAGPKWYGLIGKSTRHRKVLVKPAGVQSITVDDQYIAKSIRQPNLHLAIRETALQLGSAYPPSMPPYPHLTPQEVPCTDRIYEDAERAGESRPTRSLGSEAGRARVADRTASR